MKRFLIGLLAGAVLLIGASIGWAAAVTWNGYTVVNITLEGQPFVSDPPGILVESSTFLPVRALAEALGLTVTWEQATMTAHLSKPVAVTTEAAAVNIVGIENIRSVLRERGRPVPDDAAIQAALDQVDQAAILSAEAAGIVIQIWDGVSPINGVPASHFWSRVDFKYADQVYMLRRADSGNLIYVQPHAPNISGMEPMTANNVQSIAEAHRNEVAGEQARPKIIEAVIRVLAGN